MADAARASRLTRYFSDVIRGNRSIKTSHDGRLFLESTCQQQPASTCVEKLISSKQGLDALNASARCDTSDEYLVNLTLPMIRHFSDPTIELLNSGAFLRSIVIGIVEPPTVWHRLQELVKGTVSAGDLETFAWLSSQIVKMSFAGCILEDHLQEI